MNEAISTLSLSGFQELNAGIYGRQNDRHFGTGEIVRRMSRQAIKVLETVQNGNDDHFLSYRLAMTFSWSLALANRLHLDLTPQVKLLLPKSQTQFLPEIQDKYARLATWDSTDPTDFPSKMDTATRLVIEMPRVDEALEDFQATHGLGPIQEVATNLMGVIGRICIVATSARLNLAVEMVKHFVGGCPKCLKTPCECPFSVPKMV